MVYLSARDRYDIQREDKAGVGYVDYIFYPSVDMTDDCMIVELKVNHTAEEVIQQIKDRNYAQRFIGKLGERERYTGRILTVGISYFKNDTGKRHECKIEVLRERKQTLVAYYSKGCDSRELFRGLEIGTDQFFEQHLNKYDVISLDIQWMKTSAVQAIKKGKAADVISYINDEVLKELREYYPEYLGETTVSLAKALADINMKTGSQFIIIVDEWDCFFRENKDNKALLSEYVDFLRSLFKGQIADQFIKLAYITGILPIKKYGTQSALNNFRELTMANPDGIARYIGFTESEVRKLCRD